MLDGKEINETAKRFLMNWKASRDARRRQRRQLNFLEGGTSTNFISGSSNALTSIPSLPPLPGSQNPGLNPVIYEGVGHGVLPKGTKPLAAIVQARAPNSTLLNRKPVEDISQSRYAIFRIRTVCSVGQLIKLNASTSLCQPRSTLVCCICLFVCLFNFFIWIFTQPVSVPFLVVDYMDSFQFQKLPIEFTCIKMLCHLIGNHCDFLNKINNGTGYYSTS